MEQGWKTVEDFVDTLGRAIDKESVQIKETRLVSDKRFERAHLFFGGDFDTNTLVIVESDDCVVVPATGGRSHPHQVSLSGVTRDVWKVEERFQGDELTTLVCHLRPVPGDPALKEE